MPSPLAIGGYVLLGLLAGVSGALGFLRLRSAFQPAKQTNRPPISTMIREHFNSTPLDQITLTEKKFPLRVRPDLQKAIGQLFDGQTEVLHFCGIHQEFSHQPIDLSGCMIETIRNQPQSVPPQYEEVDVGDDDPVPCLANGLWFLEQTGERFIVLLTPASRHGEVTGLQFQIGTINNPEGSRISREFFRHLEESVIKAESYRGKILSLEKSEYSYSGQSTAITVHQLRTVTRDQVILSRKTLDLLDRNIIGFVQQRPGLAKSGQSTRKGILFYGPPGTGKTHTIHYLAKALPGHTTLLITAEQVTLLSEYMTLARLLQPSIVVIEDVDLIARDRSQMENSCDEVLLNKLLNEMDGLKEDADILFILTTNRPEMLEQALASRPGRVDQAIEFPLPDAEGRLKLARLYLNGMQIAKDVEEMLVRRTENVSAAFIKELIRRSVQYQLERNDEQTIQAVDIESALEEMLITGGSLNLKLLGAGRSNNEALNQFLDES